MEKQKLDAAILAVMADVEYVKKDGRNQQQGFTFASAENIVGEIRAAALKHKLMIGVSYVEAIDLETGETKAGSKIYRVRVKAEVTLRCQGESETRFFYGEGSDSGDKALAKAKTMCLKQFLRQAFLIETGDADADKETPPESVTMTADAAKLKALPQDIKNGFAWLKKNSPAQTDASYRKGVLMIIDANNNDPEALRSFLRDKGWRGNVDESDLAAQVTPT